MLINQRPPDLTAYSPKAAYKKANAAGNKFEVCALLLAAST